MIRLKRRSRCRPRRSGRATSRETARRGRLDYQIIGTTSGYRRRENSTTMLPADAGTTYRRDARQRDNATMRTVFVIRTGQEDRRLTLVYPVVSTGRNFEREVLRVIDSDSAHVEAQGCDARGLEQPGDDVDHRAKRHGRRKRRRLIRTDSKPGEAVRAAHMVEQPALM